MSKLFVHYPNLSMFVGAFQNKSHFFLPILQQIKSLLN